MTLILARLVDSRGNVLTPPNPAAQLLEHGNPIQSYTLDEIFDLALAQIEDLRRPKETELIRSMEQLRSLEAQGFKK